MQILKNLLSNNGLRFYILHQKYMHQVHDDWYFPNNNYPSFTGNVIEGTIFFAGKNFIKKQFHIQELP
jgi:hypothetical protein